MIALRDYQQQALDKIYAWWMSHLWAAENPLAVLPTGSGKSIVIAKLTCLMFDTWPEEHPRTIVLVPSKELAEQNAEKLTALIPRHLKVGFYSASIGRKDPTADVIVATIGSIYKEAHRLGDIKCVVIDEAHLVNPDGESAGRYRQFLQDLAKYCKFRVVGFTATPFRGNGAWLTEGDAPLFTGVSGTVTVQELLDQGYLAPLVRPVDMAYTRVQTDGIATTNGDFNLGQLAERVEGYLPSAADDACALAVDRKKWLAFLPTVANANTFSRLMNDRGISASVVTGETPKKEREVLIDQFRKGQIRCLVTVLALATGFDVPDVDCICWLRPTKSPVLYVQGAGRGMRIADGKTDCLWLDFSDTTERLGPVDAIKGRTKRSPSAAGAPSAICNNCGEVVRPASLMFCPSCGAQMREHEMDEGRAISNHPVLTSQAGEKLKEHNVTKVSYAAHRKADKPISIRVDYWDGLNLTASEWVCPIHGGFATDKAQQWIDRRTPDINYRRHFCDPANHGIRDVKDGRSSMWSVEIWIETFAEELFQPSRIVVNHKEKFPEIVPLF